MRRTKVGTWLHKRIKQEGLTLRTVGAAAGISHVTIHNIIFGEYNPSSSTCIKIARGLDADPDILLEMAGHRPARMPEDQMSFSVYLSRKFPEEPELQALLKSVVRHWHSREKSDQ